jgi:hypothetical protein
MNKKFLSVILFSALMVGTAGTFTSCKDYDDDIDQINNELTGIKASISDLQAKVGDGKFVTNVVKNGDGITITWSDNTTSTIGTIKGDKGDKGDAATITIDPVTKNFIINNEDTGICSEGKNGVNGINAKAPSISKETGNWVTYEWDAEKNDYVGTDTGISAMGASTYVVDKTSYWELHVATSENGEGEPAVIKLPKAASITSLKAVSINDGRIEAANVTMSYGKALGADVKFNNVTYKKDAILLSQTSTLSAIVNPQDADATKYAYILSDSKGNMPFKVTNPVANMTEDALTRAASVNKGVFDMTVEYLSTANCGKSAGTYALTTETADGLVASAYDVKVTEKAVSAITVTSLKALSVDINKELDLIGCFKNTAVATVDGTAVADLTPYIVDYYFEIADKTAAANLGATISGNTIKAEKAGSLNIKVNYLLVNGTVAEAAAAKTITVTFIYVAPSTTLGDVEWTVNKTNADFFLPLGDIQAALAGSTDTDLPSVAKVGSITWADGKALTEKTITVNGVKYGKDGTAFDENWITTIDASTLYVKNSAGQYVSAAGSKIQTPLYIKFNFDYTKAFPAEESYQIVLGLKKAGATVNAFEIPVKVTIKSPAESAVSPFSRLSAYFVGDNAVAYGSANGTNVEYNLFKLYKDMGTEKGNVAFTETLHEIDGHNCAAWIVETPTNPGDISVKVYDNAQNADNRDNVYSTREIQAAYTVFGNVHIAKIVDKFNLTVKSEIKEGVLEATTAANASGNGVSPIKVSLKNITAKDVYGEAYNLTQMYKKSGANYVEDTTEPMDSRIQSVRVVLADDNAKEYLAIEDHGGNQFAPTETDAYSYFSVVKKSAETALQNDVPCKVSLVVLDKWGATTTTTVTITLKK